MTLPKADHDQLISPFVQKMMQRQHLDTREQSVLTGLAARNIREVKHRAAIADTGFGDAVSVLLDGWACRIAVLPSGKRRIIAFYLPGDVCDFELFHTSHMDQPILAIGAVRVAEISRQAFSDLARNQPRLGQALWQDAMAGAAIQRAWTINVGQRAASKRLAHLFCELHTRLAQIGLASATASTTGCACPLTQADLGDACALTSIHTNRAIQEMRRDGLLDLHAGRLKIHDWDALAALGEFDPAYLQPVTEEEAAPAIRVAR